jgi:glycine cleavage system transcriptional repressor
MEEIIEKDAMTMEKAVISILGKDRPGIVAAVSKILFENRCNIEDVNQTILQTEFAGIFIATLPKSLSLGELERRLKHGLKDLGLHVLVKPFERPETPSSAQESEPFVVTTIGSDQLGLVAGITEVMADFGVNITNLRALFRGGDDPFQNMMIYEIDIPVEIDYRIFSRALKERAIALKLDLSLQHRDVFEAIHRV